MIDIGYYLLWSNKGHNSNDAHSKCIRQVHKILKHKLQIFALTAAGQKLDGL